MIECGKKLSKYPSPLLEPHCDQNIQNSDDETNNRADKNKRLLVRFLENY